MSFFDRSDELEIIGKALKRPYCFVVLTGRRRIGKTRLVREALAGTEHIELFIPRKRRNQVLEQLRSSIAEQTGFSPDFSDLGTLLEYLFRKEKRPVFIDEISNLQKVDPGSFSDIQRIYDRYKEECGIHLIVDGSYVGVMKRIFQDRKEPLFGRATDVIQLRPLPIKDSIEMAMEQGFGPVDSLEARSILGGVPRYLELIHGYRDMGDLKERIFDQGSIFPTEPENILIQEFGASWETYFSILEVIAAGATGPSAIANELDMNAQMVPKYLNRLIGIGILTKEKPLFGKKKQVRYSISDPYLDFWFGVYYPRIELYREGVSRVPLETIDSAIGRAMERTIREIVSLGGVLPFNIDGIGSWWNRSGDEIDIVAFNRKGSHIAFGEVKWGSHIVGPDVVSKLIERSVMVQWNQKKRSETLFIVSRSGFNKKAMEFMEQHDITGMDTARLMRIVLDPEGGGISSD